MISIFTNSVAETRSFAREIASKLLKGDVIAFVGGLGAGKTAFCRGLAAGLNIDENEVHSPTFSIVNEYHGDKYDLYHFDMYRIMNEEALETTGFYDYLDGENILAIEWSENITQFLPKNFITITIETVDENKRKITVIGDERF